MAAMALVTDKNQILQEICNNFAVLWLYSPDERETNGPQT